MIISFIYYVTLSKFVDSSFPPCNVHTGVQGRCLAFTPISNCENWGCKPVTVLAANVFVWKQEVTGKEELIVFAPKKGFVCVKYVANLLCDWYGAVLISHLHHAMQYWHFKMFWTPSCSCVNPSICHQTYFHTSKGQVTWIIKKVNRISMHCGVTWLECGFLCLKVIRSWLPLPPGVQNRVICVLVLHTSYCNIPVSIARLLTVRLTVQTFSQMVSISAS